MSSAAPPRPAMAGVRPYRDFLTPSLHRRFTSAALLCLVVCYGEAMLMGRWDLFWSWFPFGPTGIRALLLFVSVLAIYILRIAQLHIGARTANSPLDTSIRYITTSPFTVIQTLFWYILSAWLFGETYIWSASAGAKLSMVDDGNHQQRAHLNERPIYLRTLFLCLGVAQAFFHLYKDYDQVLIAAGKSFDSSSMSSFVKAMTKMKQNSFSVASAVPIRTVLSVVAITIVYVALLRHIAWYWTYWIAKRFYSIPKASTFATIPPSPAGLLLHALASATLLMIMWEFANQAFGAFVGQEPLKKGVPLSERANVYANPTLLAGLKSKKEIIKTFAFWELLIIAQAAPQRRKSIFSDYGIPNRVTTWSELVTVCLGQVNAVVARIQDFQKPDTNPAQPAPEQQNPLHSLPKLSTPLKQGALAAAPAPKTRTAFLEKQIGSVAKAIGQAPSSIDPITPRARKLISYTEEKLLPPQATPAGIKQQLNSLATTLLRSPLGYPFRQTFSRRATAVILGTPNSQLTPLVHGITALTRLAASSLSEDPYGHVSADVPNIIRTFTSTCETVEGFVGGLSVHWTDVCFDEEHGGRRVQDVEVLVGALRESLTVLVNQFGEYADTMGLSREEVRRAKEVVARGNREQVDS